MSCTAVYKRTGVDGLAIFIGRHKSPEICPLCCYHSKSTFILPWQVFPSPVYPVLQVQIYDPRVLEQFALMSHTGEEAPHSSMSRTANILIDEKIIDGHLLRPSHVTRGVPILSWFHESFFRLKFVFFSPCLISLNLPVNFSSIAASVAKYETFTSVV